MSLVRVYEPCECCQGTGWIPIQQGPLGTFTSPNVTSGFTTCTRCNGTGKGPIKEIREEPTRWMR